MATGNTGVKVKNTDGSIEGRNPLPNGSDSVSTYSKTAPKFPGNVPETNPKPNGKDSLQNYNSSK